MTVLVPADIKSLRLRLDVVGSGNVWFDDVQIRKTSDPVTSLRKLDVTYTAFKSPIQIEETGVDKLSFTYSDNNQRSTMYYGSLDDKLLRPLRKHYSADGTMEIKQNTATGTYEFVTYIGGDGYSAPIAVKSDGTNQNYLYLHRDYQGSILAITNDAGALVEKRLFDGIIKVQDGAGNVLSGLTVLDRGYTGHKHLQSAADNNMKLVILWFGSWKNGESHYTPDWVKTDMERFPRMLFKDGKITTTISNINKNCLDADLKAYKKLMQRIAQVDKNNTVLMMQIENEVAYWEEQEIFHLRPPNYSKSRCRTD